MFCYFTEVCDVGSDVNDFRPSDPFFLGLQSSRQSDTKVYRELVFYSDVARLSHRFCMPGFEKWAAGKLTSLMASSVGDSLMNACEAHTKGQIPSLFFTILAYAKLTLNVSLEHSTRHAIQCQSVYPQALSAPNLLKLMHTPGMREGEPALFGYWFLLLLNLGHQNWDQKAFTKQDRVALFSAQARLTPLPETLGKDLVFSLLVEPRFTKDDHLEELKERTCSSRCLHEISNIWHGLFDCDYYDEVMSNVAPTWMSMLLDLPTIRSDFAETVRSLPACKCNSKVVAWLDEDIKRLFTRLAGYYQDIN